MSVLEPKRLWQQRWVAQVVELEQLQPALEEEDLQKSQR